MSLFDPLAFAARIDAETLITCQEGERGFTTPLVEALGGKATLSVRSGRGHLDHKFAEDWLAGALGVD